MPSRHAAAEELIALAAACGEVEGTLLEFIPPRTDRFDDASRDLLVAMSRAARRPLNWNAVWLGVSSDGHAAREMNAYAAAHEARIVGLNLPIPSRARFSFRTGFVLDAIPDWQAVLTLPAGQRLVALRDPAVRDRLRAGAAKAEGSLIEIADWANRVISQTFTEQAQPYQGRRVAEIAQSEGKDPLDALLDVVCADELKSTFTRPPRDPSPEDWAVAVAAWRAGWALIGASDAGAHLDFTAYFDYPVYVLEKAVRQHRALPLDEAVAYLTDAPARLYGLRSRGRIADGYYGDIVVFDEQTVSTGTLEIGFDLPAGSARLFAEPSGIDTVLVNGVPVRRQGAAGPNLPGQLLRSGRDTYTPALA